MTEQFSQELRSSIPAAPETADWGRRARRRSACRRAVPLVAALAVVGFVAPLAVSAFMHRSTIPAGPAIPSICPTVAEHGELAYEDIQPKGYICEVNADGSQRVVELPSALAKKFIAWLPDGSKYVTQQRVAIDSRQRISLIGASGKVYELGLNDKGYVSYYNKARVTPQMPLALSTEMWWQLHPGGTCVAMMPPKPGDFTVAVASQGH